MKKIIVLGAGLVGRPMVLDLLNEKEVQLAVADLSSMKLDSFKKETSIQRIEADLSDEKVLKHTISGFDFVINAVPGFMGYQTLKYILEAGKNVVDIAFSPEDLNDLNDLAVQNDVTALVDFGVAPGLSHLAVAHSAELMDSLDKVRIYVGGLPKRRSKPFEYAAVFSPIDVIEEYTRPARLVQDGRMLVKEALTDIEELEFDRVGTLEAFNSDGLRSLVDSIVVRDMAEKHCAIPVMPH
jgi:lysine 6-dehydrogenase